MSICINGLDGCHMTRAHYNSNIILDNNTPMKLCYNIMFHRNYVGGGGLWQGRISTHNTGKDMSRSLDVYLTKLVTPILYTQRYLLCFLKMKRCDIN